MVVPETGTLRLLQRLAQAGVMPTPEALKFIQESPRPGDIVARLLAGWDQRMVYCDVADVLEAVEALEDDRPAKPAPERVQEPRHAGPATARVTSRSTGAPPDDMVREIEAPGELSLTPPTPPTPESLAIPATLQTLTTPPSGQTRFRAPSLKILEDQGEHPISGTGVEDFAAYFEDRYRSLAQLVRRRAAMREAREITHLDRGLAGSEVRLVALVTEVNQTPKGLRVKLEDLTGSILASNYDDPTLLESHLVTDEVVGLAGRFHRRNRQLKLLEVIRPSLERVSPPPSRVTGPCNVAFISDIHLGSRTFLQEVWERLLTWINTGEGPQGELVERLGYLVLTGDVVDGIDAYPDQEKELLITDYNEQYRLLGQSLANLPRELQIILMAGNHDAVRLMEPQPALPLALQSHFSDNVTFLSNPASFELDGVRVLAYHGKSMDDMVTHVPHVTYDDPLSGMREMLERRHLAPVFGDKTPMVPTERDHHVIRQVPHIFVTGHVHATGVGRYRGVLLVNPGTWQSQTDFQKMMNFSPDPGKAVVVELDSLTPHLLDFNT